MTMFGNMYSDGLWISPRSSLSHNDHDEDPAVEFEFCHTSGSNGGAAAVQMVSPVETSAQASGMSSADELFSDGKLRPLRPPDSAMYHQRGRRLSMESSRCPSFSYSTTPAADHFHEISDSSSIMPRSGMVRRSSVSLGNSRCSSPSRNVSVSLPPTTPPSPKSLRYSSRKFRDFFKPSRKDEKSSSLKGGSSVFSHKSFWPFSRSNSAGENKTTAAVAVPRRSRSAGEGKTSYTHHVGGVDNYAVYKAKHAASDDNSAKLLSSATRNFAKGSPGRRGSGAWSNDGGLKSAINPRIKPPSNCSLCTTNTSTLVEREGTNNNNNNNSNNSNSNNNACSSYHHYHAHHLNQAGIKISPVLNVPVCIIPLRSRKVKNNNNNHHNHHNHHHHRFFSFGGIFSRKQKANSVDDACPTSLPASNPRSQVSIRSGG